MTEMISPFDGRSDLEEMTRGECLERLATARVGRIGLSVGALPCILPVVFVLFEDGIFFRSAAGTKLTAATSEAVVAFEADDHLADGSAGWSVLVVGTCGHTTDVRLVTDVEEQLGPAWSPARQADHIVRIDVAQVTGRKFGELV